MSKARRTAGAAPATGAQGGAGTASYLDRLCRVEPDPPIRAPDRALADGWAPAGASEAGLVEDMALSFRAHAQRLLGMPVTTQPLAFYPNTLDELRACFIRGLRNRIAGAEARLAVIWWKRLEDAERFALAAYLAIPAVPAPAAPAPVPAAPVPAAPVPSREPVMAARMAPRAPRANRGPRVAHNPTQERAPAPAAQAATLWGE